MASWRAVVGALIVTFMVVAGGAAQAETRALKLYNMHTQERATIVFKRNGKFDRAGLAKVNHFLRDWRRNEPTKMDPALLDLIWEVYRKTGSDEYIHVVCGYRSPATNSMLRKRSKGVAQNSQHVRGKAMDFFIPGVPLADLRAIGLREQDGGVGYYPTSGSPFVHLDTGSVRHWPKMTRSQLAKVFPNGKTLHIPADGEPLPGYAQALAAHKLRGSSNNIKVASFDADNDDDASGTPIPPRKSRSIGEPVVIASVSGESDEDTSDDVADLEPPLPRPSPFPTEVNGASVIVATAQPVPQSLQPRPETQQFAFVSIGSEAHAARPASTMDFEAANNWSTPSVPADLARAMAKRDVSRPASVPIRPTAVVATIDVSRPLRAEAMTSAVMQGDNGSMRDVTPVFAYAATMEASAPVAPPPMHRTVSTTDPEAPPVPVANPMRAVVAPVTIASAAPIAQPEARDLSREDLTLTALDTLGLRLWMAHQSTRQKQYAVLTMPDFSRIPSLIEKPVMAYGDGFGDLSYQGLRTDRFSGTVLRLPPVVDLQSRQRLAYR
jgi:uncharacterized protein YcbK (DUF882 family)